MRRRNSVSTSARLFLALIGAGLFACSGPPMDGSTPASKQAVFETVDLALSHQDCATAVTAITPLLNSSYSDNDVRMKAASAYGCDASISLLPLIANLSTVGATTLAGSGLWSTMASFFPSTAGSDYVVEGAELATDTLQAVLNPGALVLAANQVNAGSHNVGSVFYSDRTADANLYLTFVAMAGIGGLENRYGQPNSTTHIKTVNLPWTTAAVNTTGSDGCAYASFILNMVDAMSASQNYVPTLKGSFSGIISSFQTALNAACNQGCTGGVPPAILPLNDKNKWVNTGCNIAAGCSTCPADLRDRTKCTAAANDAVSCAAAGIVNFINSSSLGWN